jgi:hypothetical protein
MLGIHQLGLTHETNETKIRNNNGDFIPISPDEWRTRYDMDVTVGIGNGSKNQQMFQMQSIEQTIQSIVSGGGLGTLITPTNLWNFAMEKARVTGRKDGNLFFSKPETDDVDTGPSIEEQALQAQTALEQQKLELKAAELELDKAKLELEEQRLEFQAQQHADENQFKIAELQLEAEQRRAVKVGE